MVRLKEIGNIKRLTKCYRGGLKKMDRTKKLWAPIFAHFSNNAIALAVFLV